MEFEDLAVYEGCNALLVVIEWIAQGCHGFADLAKNAIHVPFHTLCPSENVGFIRDALDLVVPRLPRITILKDSSVLGSLHLVKDFL